MRKPRPILAVAILLPAVFFSPTNAAEAARRALLVGCSTYPSLPASKQLEGAAGDVALVREMLLTKFQFAEADIVTLAEAAGPEHWPTRENIRSAFLRLAQESAAGDYVFIHLGGHGSQEPDQDRNPQVDFEPDGLDETYLPRDVGRWTSSRARVENAIVDDEFRQWLSAIVAKGAFVFLVADSCHSGTLARGSDSEVSRSVRGEDLGIPAEVMAGEAGSRSSPATPPGPAPDWLDQAQAGPATGGLVAISAAQANQVAIEEQFTPDGPRHGRLSYTLSQILGTCNKPLNYRELAQRILWHYTKNGWTYRSTPAIEGTDLERAVLGTETWSEKKPLQLTSFEGRHIVMGGTFQQVTVGSVLAVHPAPDSGDPGQLLGYVEVREAGPFSAVVEPVEFRGRPAPEALPELARCELAFHSLGNLRIVVDVAAEGTEDPEEASRWRATLVDRLRPLAEEDDSPICLREDSSAVQWFVVATPQGVFLQRAGSSRPLDDREGKWLGEVLGPRPLDSDLSWWLGQSLRRIARATNLIALADEAAANEDPEIDVELAVVRNGTPFAPAGPDQAEVRAKELLEMSIANRGREAISVAVFYVDSAFGITPFFPKSSRDSLNNEIAAEGELYRPVRFRIDDSTLGWEHVLVVAVTSKQKSVVDDLLMLQQPGCSAGSRGQRGCESSPAATPLGRLIAKTLRGCTRSGLVVESPEISSYAIRRVSWDVVP